MQNEVETLVELELLWIVALKQRGHPFDLSGVNFQKYNRKWLGPTDHHLN